MYRDRDIVSDRAVRSNLIVVSTPSLHLFSGIGKRQEPVRVQALRTELAIERFDEAIIRRLAGPGEVQGDVVRRQCQIKTAFDAFLPLPYFL